MSRNKKAIIWNDRFCRFFYSSSLKKMTVNESWKIPRKPSLFKFSSEAILPILKFHKFVLFKGDLLPRLIRMVLYEDK